MDEEAAAELAPDLESGERLIWAGRPYPPVYIFYNGGMIGCFSTFPVLALAITDWRFAILVPALALWLFAMRYRGQNVRYGLSEKRAIILRKWPWRTVESIPVERFNVCIRQNFDKEVASIMFRKTRDPLNFWRGTPFRADAFVGIRDADHVEKLIEKLSHHRAEQV